MIELKLEKMKDWKIEPIEEEDLLFLYKPEEKIGSFIIEEDYDTGDVVISYDTEHTTTEIMEAMPACIRLPSKNISVDKDADIEEELLKLLHPVT